MTSRHIIFPAARTVVLETREVEAPKEGQVLLRAQASLISTGTEMICFNGEFQPGSHWDKWVQYPFAPGYCVCGTVEMAGKNAPFAVGERLVTQVSHRELGPVAPLSFRVPDGVSSQHAAFYPLSSIVQNGVRRAKHELGDAVVVIGAGLIGQLVVQYLRILGAREIIVVDFPGPRLELAKSFGATQTLGMSVSDPQVREAVFDLTQGKGADVVYDVTGHPAAFEAGLALVRRFGTLLLLGDAPDPSQQRLTGDVVTRGLKIVGAHVSNPPDKGTDHEPWGHAEIVALFFSYLGRGMMDVERLISHRFRPEECAQVYEMLGTRRSEAMGVVFDWMQ